VGTSLMLEAGRIEVTPDMFVKEEKAHAVL
jgi:hypothetical protein